MQKRTEGDEAVPVVCSDSSSDRSLPDDGDDPRNIPVRSNDRRCFGTGSIPWSSSRIYILPCNSGYVRCKCIEVIQVWTRIYTNAGVFIAAWNACIVWSIDYCNQVPDEVYQKQ